MSDELADLLKSARAKLADGKSAKARTRLLWSAAKSARGLAPADLLRKTFTQLAMDAGLIDKRGHWPPDVRDSVRRHGAEDIAHVLDWALRGLNPFEKGPLK